MRTNVLDEREFYTFHQSAQWISTVRWRVRAVRGDQFKQRINGLPVAQTGAWSDIYSSSNPAFTTGPIQSSELCRMSSPPGAATRLPTG